MDYSKEQPGQPGWKITFQRRLQAEGRWLEAEQRQAALRNGGMAKEKTWLEIHREFPPLGFEGAGRTEPSDAPAVPERAAPVAAAPTGEEAPEVPDNSSPPARSRLDLKRDVLWTYENFTALEQKKIPVKKAPSTGAWAYAQWALKNPTTFFKDVVPKVLKLEDDAESKGREDDEREQFKLLDIFEREEKEARAAKEAQLELEQACPAE